MPFAARVGDITNHPGLTPGAIVGPGASTGPVVLIGGQPAALALDQHACGHPAGHPPNPIPVGSFTVFINGRPALRFGDAAGCGAFVVSGAPNVLIG